MSGGGSGEVKVRAERGLAMLDTTAAPHGGDRKLTGVETCSPLAEMRKGTRALIRKLAGLTDAAFEERLAEARADETMGVSTGRVLRLPSALADRLRKQRSDEDRERRCITTAMIGRD